ncbi:uncharacterized protein GLRG_05525 [Colletotrichum graminicola M1.001]|uniref:Uncharacterized protein n=1 Tax=Colletotrichum graminicola (strain M1.001 / M2 / FGSC 10212) TaxID=645133 RepID=E3QHP3_COLGM|nr:uncharacterized protein GLRG_05525 [Colletotrichum graminicola M1.001]EFQ30381.1 hypothetical protein GLRG_05525 [Colletotrichum graminicola M1.001]
MAPTSRASTGLAAHAAIPTSPYGGSCPSTSSTSTGHATGSCASTTGGGSVCFVQEPPYTGASWGNFNRKRDVQGGDDEAPAGCGRPQELGLPDGTRVSLAFDSPDDISEQFQEPKIAA